MKRLACLSLFLLVSIGGLSSSANAQNSQSYLNDLGSTPYGINIPVENGFINVSNGNLHLEFALAAQSQRGALSLSERITYDSRIWEFLPFGSNGSYHWWPYNVPGTTTFSAGWQFIRGNELGSFTYSFIGAYTYNCPGGGGDGSDPDQGTSIQQSINYIDPNGSVHPTAAIITTQQGNGGGTAFGSGCTYSQSISAGQATDGSGYSIRDDGSGNPLVIDSAGTQVYPQIIDRYGNFLSSDSQGNLLDSAGRVPVITTQNGNVTYYDVLSPNGSINNNGNRVRYTVTTGSISVATQFNQSDTYDWTGPYLTPVQSIGLPDGSQYSFSYDSYGGLTSMTLPTGGTVNYSYSNFVDSSNTSNRWLTSRTVDNGTTTFTPSVVTACANYSTGCVEQVNLHKPSGDETVYQLTLNNGAWNTAVSPYTGAASNGQQLSQTSSVNTYTNGCASANCYGANYLSQSLAKTTLYPTGVQSQTQSFYNSTDSKPNTVKEWDFVSSGQGFPSNPDRETDYTYTGYDLHQVTLLDQTRQQVSQTTYSYTSSATATSGITQHGTANAGGPYLQTASQWINTTGTTLDQTMTFDDTGTLLSSTDPNGTTTYGHDGPDILVTSVTLPTPSSGVSLTNSATYDANSGVILTQTDPNGGMTIYSGYDALNRPAGIGQPIGFSSYSYSPNQSGVYPSIDSNRTGNIQTLYDAYGRKSRSAVFNGQTNGNIQWYQADYCYDSSGRLQFQSTQYVGSGFGGPNANKQCSGNGTSYTYDALGRVANISNADGTATTIYQGRAVKTTDVNIVQKITQSDAFGRISGVCEISSNTSMPNSGSPVDCGMDISGTGFVTSYVYDLANHKTTVTQGAQTRVVQTDSIGRTIMTSEPERGITTYSYAYNSTGLQVTRTRPRANQSSAAVYTTTTTQYDSLGRSVTVSYTDGSATNPLTTSKSFTYDLAQLPGIGYSTGYSKGRLIGAVGGTVDVFNYDIGGNVTGYFQCLPAFCGRSGTLGHDLLFSYTYDLLGNRTSDQYQNWAANGASVTTSYAYNNAGQLTSISGGQNNATGAPTIVSVSQSSPFGPSTWTYGNGLTAGQTYDTSGRVSGLGVCNNGVFQPGCNGGQIYGFNVTPHGAQVSSSCDSVPGWCSTYAYDEFNRLTSTTRGDGYNFAFGYDRYGNRWSQTPAQSGPAPGFSYDAGNNRIGGLAYDAAGNMTGDGFYSYQYDAEGNLANVNGGQTASYGYDSFNRRVERRWAGNSSLSMPALEETAYNPEGQRVEIWDGSTGNMVQAQTYWGSLPTAYYKEGTIHFQHQDWLGNQRVTTSNTDAIESGAYALAFGDGPYAGGRDIDANHFAQLDEDYETGTDHAQFREYSAGQGRWMSPDPYDGSYNLGNPQSLNRYAYVGNNPLSFTDPSGENPCVVAEGFGSAFGGPVGGALGLGVCVADILYSVARDIEGIVGLFSHPAFTASHTARPGQIWDERGSYHAKPYSGPADIFGLGNQGCEFGACGFQQGGGWEIDKRPLQGVPFAQGLGLFHYYFFNTSTHESVGLGPAKGSGMFCSVPGKFETNEKRGTLYLPIPSASQQKCVDEKLRHRGSPGNYTFYDSFGDRGGSMNCHGYVSSVVAACALQ